MRFNCIVKIPSKLGYWTAWQDPDQLWRLRSPDFERVPWSVKYLDEWLLYIRKLGYQKEGRYENL